MKSLLALAFVAGSIALPACTTVVEKPAPRTTVTTEESVAHRPMMGGTATTTETRVSSY